VSVANLGVLLRDQRQPQAAEPLLRRAMSGLEAALGATHQLTRYATMALALLLAQEGRNDAEVRALVRFDEPLGPQIPETTKDARALAGLLRARGAADEAANLERCLGL
jgi:hypothetical protein